MGSMKEQMIEGMQERNDHKLAAYLGITYDELQETGFEFHDNIGNDDMVYDHYLTFSDDAPDAILNKIGGIDMENRMVDIPLNWSYEPEED